MHVIAPRRSRFTLAADRRLPDDQRRTIENARVLAESLASQGARLVSGGTDNHLMLVDVTPLGVTGKEAEHLLDEIGITVNKNAIPFDPLPAEHRVRDPHRHAGHDVARLRARRDPRHRPDHHRGHPRPRRPGDPGPARGRGPRDLRALPGSGAARRLTSAAPPAVAAASDRAMTVIPSCGTRLR